MGDIYSNLYAKRFRLPKCYTHEDQKNIIDQGYSHAAAFYLTGKNSLTNGNFLSYGENNISRKVEFITGDHAEIAALKKLRARDYKKKQKNVDLLVVRINKSGRLSCSKPCSYCIENLYSNLPKIGYKLKNIYYSHHNEEIIKTTLKELYNSERFETSYFKWQMRIKSKA